MMDEAKLDDAPDDHRDRLEARARYFRDECLRARARVKELEHALRLKGDR
jgi:hypothetical protein